MFCVKCQNDLVDCKCDDLEERLQRLAKSPYVHLDRPDCECSICARAKQKAREHKDN